ncbi:RICIN domain-containing protein [Streptomyces erythrochromogenes]|uniref:RICIN domain-containing protein n=1 Tax=Streptomyces erythrochromogenes TaxID=285574 RepID=UPI0036915921
MKGATGAADELARFLVELTAGLTVREMAQRYGGGKTSWGEYRSGTRIIPRGRLNAVVRDRVRDGRGREAMLRRAGRLHDAALVAGADAGPPPRLDEALRRAEADLAESERIVRQLATVIATLLAEQEATTADRHGQAGPAAQQAQTQTQAQSQTQSQTQAQAQAQAGATEPQQTAEPEAGDTGGGLLERAMEQLAAVWSVRAAALRIGSLRGTAARAVPAAYARTALPSGNDGLALELARTADVLEYARWEVQLLEHDLDEERRAYEGPLEGVVLERTDRPTAAPVTAVPAGSAGPLTVVVPPVARAAPGRAGLVAAAVLGVVMIAAVVLVVLGGRQPLVVPVGAGPVQPHAPTHGGATAGSAPGSGTPSAGPSGSASASAPAPSGRAPAPVPPASGPASPHSPSPGGGGPTPTVPSAAQTPPGGAEPSLPAAGLVRLANTGSRRCLSVPQDSTTPADPLALADCGEQHEQLWHLTKESSGPAGTVYSIRNRFSGLCLSVDAARVTNDATVTQYLCGDRQGLFPDQLWTMRFHPASAAWQLVNVNSGKCVAARVGGGASDPAFQQDCREDPWLTWRV